jgi:hypothetical protein
MLFVRKTTFTADVQSPLLPKPTEWLGKRTISLKIKPSIKNKYKSLEEIKEDLSAFLILYNLNLYREVRKP